MSEKLRRPAVLATPPLKQNFMFDFIAYRSEHSLHQSKHNVTPLVSLHRPIIRVHTHPSRTYLLLQRVTVVTATARKKLSAHTPPSPLHPFPTCYLPQKRFWRAFFRPVSTPNAAPE